MVSVRQIELTHFKLSFLQHHSIILSLSSMKRSSTLLSAVMDIVRVFVDAALHVPPHR